MNPEFQSITSQIPAEATRVIVENDITIKDVPEIRLIQFHKGINKRVSVHYNQLKNEDLVMKRLEKLVEA